MVTEELKNFIKSNNIDMGVVCDVVKRIAIEQLIAAIPNGKYYIFDKSTDDCELRVNVYDPYSDGNEYATVEVIFVYVDGEDVLFGAHYVNDDYDTVMYCSDVIPNEITWITNFIQNDVGYRKDEGLAPITELTDEYASLFEISMESYGIEFE